MKKTIFVLSLAAVLLLCACGGNGSGAAPEAVSENDLSFKSGDIAINILDDAESLLEKLGEPMDYAEFDSCAYQGKDYYYYYDGFQLGVNEVDGKLKVTSVSLSDDTVTTPQGVRIGMSADKALELIPYENEGDSELLVYTNSKTELKLHTKGGKISSIDYAVK